METKLVAEKDSSLAEALKMAWPAVFESVFVVVANMIDTYMVSSLGSEYVAAVGLTAQPKYFMLAPFMAMITAVSAFVARRKGDKNRSGANAVLKVTVIFTVVLSVLIGILCIVFASPLMYFCGSHDNTHDLAVLYFRIIMGGTVFNTISMIINAAQRGSGKTKISMITNVSSSIVNIIFNYLLIYGHFGFPRLEIQGAAIATVLGTVVATILSIASLFKKDSYVNIPFMIKERVRADRETVTGVSKMSANIMLENLAMRVSFMIIAIITAKTGTDSFAAHQVGMIFLNFAFAFGDGMQIAAVTLIGHSVGAKNIEKAKGYVVSCQKLGLYLSLTMSALSLLFGKMFFRMYFSEEHIIQMGIMISYFFCAIVPVQVAQVIFNGILRGAGDVKYTLFSGTLSNGVFNVAADALFVLVLHMGIAGIWLGILLAQIMRLALLFARYKSGKWLHL